MLITIIDFKNQHQPNKNKSNYCISRTLERPTQPRPDTALLESEHTFPPSFSYPKHVATSPASNEHHTDSSHRHIWTARGRISCRIRLADRSILRHFGRQQFSAARIDGVLLSFAFRCRIVFAAVEMFLNIVLRKSRMAVGIFSMAGSQPQGRCAI